MTNISNLELKFKVSKLNNKSMSIEFFMNGQSIDRYAQLDDGIFTWRSELKFPSTIELKVTGKDPHDTQIDVNGNIIADKYIKLLDIVVDGLPCAKYYVNKIMLTTDQGKQVISNYWGFNGSVKLDFTQANSFLWSVSTQNKVNE
jgi:hypothetical protein